ncbi:hypothetical protein [Moorena bouillonii]|nr:hypothetical protein [Moorena bouillonii]
MQSLMGETTAVAHGGNPQDRLGALSVGELNSPRVAPLHRYSLFPTSERSLFSNFRHSHQN